MPTSGPSSLGLVRAGRRIHLGYLTGLDPGGGSADTGDPGGQAELALAQRLGAPRRGRSAPRDLCKLTVWITDRAWRGPVFDAIGAAMRGIHVCSTSLIVPGLADPRALVRLELEADLAAKGRDDHERVGRFNMRDWGRSDDRDPCRAVVNGDAIHRLGGGVPGA